MARYRKKPVVVEAWQFLAHGPTEGEVVRYFRRPDVAGDKMCEKCNHTMHEHGWVDTLEGHHVACIGDWIITGVHGEQYPCKPDIFAKTYEAVEDG